MANVMTANGHLVLNCVGHLYMENDDSTQKGKDHEGDNETKKSDRSSSDDDELKIFDQDGEGEPFITPLLEDKAELVRENLIGTNPLDFDFGDQQHFSPYSIGPLSAYPPTQASIYAESVNQKDITERIIPTSTDNTNVPPAISFDPYYQSQIAGLLNSTAMLPNAPIGIVAPFNGFTAPNTADFLSMSALDWPPQPADMSAFYLRPQLPNLIRHNMTGLPGIARPPDPSIAAVAAALSSVPPFSFVDPRFRFPNFGVNERDNHGNDGNREDTNRMKNRNTRAANDEDEEEDYPEQERRPHVKKPLNAFMIFMREERAKVVSGSELKESAAINQLLGRKWHSLSKDEQSKYYELAKEERENHKKQHPGWTARENYGLRRKRKKDPNRKNEPINIEQARKCRARYGSHRVDLWCRTCRRKKKCIRFTGLEEINFEAMDEFDTTVEYETGTDGRRTVHEQGLADDDLNNECSLFRTRSPMLLEIQSEDEYANDEITATPAPDVNQENSHESSEEEQAAETSSTKENDTSPKDKAK